MTSGAVLPNFPAWRLPLAQLADSAAPTGAFSHSFGMETAMAEGRLHDENGCADWLRGYLEGTLTYSDVLAIRLAHEDPERVRHIDAILAASLLAAEARAAAVTIGGRMIEIARQGFAGPRLEEYACAVAAGRAWGHPALVMALVALDHGAPWPEAALSHVMSALTSLVQVAVRAVPLGQNAGQRVLAGLHADIMAGVELATTADPAWLGAASPGVEIDELRHGQQRARMFIS